MAKKTVLSFNVSWTADHEQYFQGHGTAFTDWTDCATGCGETLRESFEDALDDLAQQDIELTDAQVSELLADLESQVKEPAMLDTDIVAAYCEDNGEHTDDNGDSLDSEHADCSVCSGEWHFYVSVDVKTNESEGE